MKAFISLLAVFTLVNHVSCEWPTFNLFTKAKPNEYVSIDSTNIKK